jgi:hypothetical protein
VKTPILTVLKLRAVGIRFPHELAKDEILDKIFSVHGHNTHIMLYQTTKKITDITVGGYD